MSGSGVRRGSGRTTSDRRAEQNRRAQAAFRERKKERLRELEALAASTGVLASSGSVAVGAGGVGGIVVHGSGGRGPQTQAPSQTGSLSSKAEDDDSAEPEATLLQRIAELERTNALLRAQCRCHATSSDSDLALSPPPIQLLNPLQLDTTVILDISAFRAAVLALPSFQPSPATSPAVSLVADMFATVAEYFSCPPDRLQGLWFRLVKVRNSVLDYTTSIEDRTAVLHLLDQCKLKYNLFSMFPHNTTVTSLDRSTGFLKPILHPDSGSISSLLHESSLHSASTLHCASSTHAISSSFSPSTASLRHFPLDKEAYEQSKLILFDRVSSLDSFKREENALIAADALTELTDLFEVCFLH
ncbi:hypothetical protein BC830DRAFT_1096824 [Chytriomyces sp. MP71]|nr:hypothetical protein BC830DRAFT_1096824 [Chytriomyces sp. MP71]